jgi:hypothetical protein
MNDEPERCDKCGLFGRDRRTLWMACFYAMNELGIPFTPVGFRGVVVKKTGTTVWGAPTFDESPTDEAPHTHMFFTLRVCKGCRSEWMTAIRDWSRAPAGDISRWNNDESIYGLDDTLPKLLADLEKARAEAAGLNQRIEAALDAVRREEGRREAEDKRKS